MPCASYAFDLSQVSVPKEEILSGGPPKDGIPALTDPEVIAGVMKVQGESYFGGQGEAFRKTLNAALADNTLIPLSELLTLETREHELFYPASWALVTFLMDRPDQEEQKSLEAYCKALQEASFGGRLFSEMFGDPEAIQTEWEQFIRSVIDDPATRWRISH